jgi:hypothetical protein
VIDGFFINAREEDVAVAVGTTITDRPYRDRCGAEIA